MNQNARRERGTAQIDIFFLLNQRKILTKKEFLAVLPRASYLSYTQAFYKRKFNKIFSESSDSEWFRSRYIDADVFANEGVLLRFRAFLENSAPDTHNRVSGYWTGNILVKNIPDTMTHEDLGDMCKKCLYFKEFNVYQLEQRKSFGRVGVISIDGDCSEAVKFMESIADKGLRISFEAVSLDEVKVRKCNLGSRSDHETCRSLFRMFCERYSIYDRNNESTENLSMLSFFDRRAEASGDPIGFYVCALRQVFFFCLYCYKQYDSVYDLRILCGDWHVSTDEAEDNEELRRVFSRKHEIYSACRSFDFVKTKNESSELDAFVLRKDADRFKCDCCIKVFSSAEFAKNHVKNRHTEVIEKIDAKINAFNRFADSIDFFMICCLSGIDDFYPPAFLDLEEKVEGVRYPDKVFSGNVVLEKHRPSD